MSKTIELPDDLYARLEALAKPFVDTTPADVIRRLANGMNSGRLESGPGQRNGTRLARRAPRERGVRFRIGTQTLVAHTVRDLFEQVLQILTRPDFMARLETLLPFRTSAQRYLIAKESVHPNGRPFVVPVSRDGVFMEAHKSYYTALTQLVRFLDRCGIDAAALD